MTDADAGADIQTQPAATYSLDELTERSGVTTRTVRYYITEGLLPPPNSAGPRASYSDTHLNRLRLIARLKEAYLPLREIRRQLQALSDEEIVAGATIATKTPYPDVADIGDHQRLRSALGERQFQQADSRESAADYLKRVSSESERDDRHDHARGHERRRLPAPTFPRPGTPWVDPTSPTAPDAGTNWKRLAIAPEAELLIEEDAYERRRQQIDSAIEWIRRILNNS